VPLEYTIHKGIQAATLRTETTPAIIFTTEADLTIRPPVVKSVFTHRASLDVEHPCEIAHGVLGRTLEYCIQHPGQTVGFAAAGEAGEVHAQLKQMVVPPHARLAGGHLPACGDVVPVVGTMVDRMQEQPLMLRRSGKIRLIKNRVRDSESGVTIPCAFGFQKIAKAQQSKALELRSVTSLARLYRDQNRGSEAQAGLSEALAKFSQGFETPDLQAAAALLAELRN